MSKQLSIIVKATDRATAPLRVVTRSITQVAAVGGRAFSGLRNVVSSLGRAMTSLPVVAGAALAAIAGGRVVSSIRETAGELTTLGQVAVRTGASIETLSFLTFLGRRLGQDARDVGDLVGDLTERVAEAVRLGSGSGVDTIKRLGAQVTDTNGRLRPTDELLGEIITKINALPESGQREFFTKEIFGDEGARFLAFFNLGLDRLNEFRREAQALGVIFTPEQVAAATRFQGALGRVSAAWIGVRAAIVGGTGDAIAGALDRLAVGIAAIPAIARRATTAMANLFGADADPVTLGRLDRLGEAAGQLVTTIIREIARTATVGVAEVAGPMAEAFFARLEREAVQRGIEFAANLPRTIAETVSLVAPQEGPLVAKLLFGPNALDTTRGQARALAEIITSDVLGPAETAGQRFDAAFASLTSGNTAQAATRLGAQTSIAFANFVESADDLLAVSDALAAVGFNGGTILSILDSLSQKASGELPGAFEQLRLGAKAAFDTLGREARDVQGFVEGLFTTTVRQASSELATAFLDATTGAKGFGEAMRDVLRSVLRMIAETIARFAILRAITGIGSAIGGAGGASGAAAGVVDGPVLPEFPTNALPFNRGGVARPIVKARAGLARIVPGPGFDRDLVPAMLTPGEAVLSRRGVAMIGGVPAIARLNRGQRRTGAGEGAGAGPVSVSVSAPITVQGSMDEAAGRELPRRLATAVVSAIESSPSLKGRVRAVAGMGVSR